MEPGGGERAQPIQIGAIILFAFLILALAGYQAVLVPQENRAVEFNHLQDVKKDFTEARDEFVDAYSTGVTRSASFELGTTYPARVFGINPGPVSGRLYTTDPGRVRVLDGAGNDIFGATCPSGVQRDARLLTYQADYNYLGDPSLYLDNTVSYLRDEEGATVVQSGQRFVSGNTINLVLLKNEVDRASTGTTTVDLVPGEYRVNTVTDPKVTVPTQLSRQAWADRIDSSKYSSISYDDSSDPHLLTVQFDGTFNVVCSPMGVDSPPPTGERTRGPVRVPGDDDAGEEGADTINPSGPGTVTLTAIRFDEGADEITLTFTNNDDVERTFERARVPFYYESRIQSEVKTLRLASNPSADEFVVGEPFEPVDATISVQPGNSVNVTLESPDNMQKNDLFEFDIEFGNGQRSRYFVDTNTQGGEGGENSGNNASQTTLVSSSAVDSIGNPANETMQFSIENTGSNAVTVTDISLDTSSAGNKVENGGGAEFTRTDTGTSLYDGTMSINGNQYDSTDTVIGGASTATFRLSRFKQGNSDVNMEGETVTLTLYFGDGSSKSYTLNG